jgi:hypothetical protein
VHTAALEPERGVVRLHVLLDRSSVEVFAGQGEVVLTDQIFPAADSRGTAVFAEGGDAVLRRLTVTPLDVPGARREANGQRSNSLSSLRDTTYRPANPITSR